MEEKYFNILIDLAKECAKKGDVPVSALIVRDGKIIAKAYNKRNLKKNVLYHAEIMVLNKSCRKLKKWILNDCDMYVTLKPCSMCEGAIRQARIKNVYYLIDKLDDKKEYYKTNIMQTNVCVLNEKYMQILKDFFREKRDK